MSTFHFRVTRAGTLKTETQEKFAVCVYPNITRSVSECWQADVRVSVWLLRCVLQIAFLRLSRNIKVHEQRVAAQ